jgi:hypothetical protein
MTAKSIFKQELFQIGFVTAILDWFLKHTRLNEMHDPYKAKNVSKVSLAPTKVQFVYKVERAIRFKLTKND